MKLKWILLIAMLIILAGFAAWGPIVSNVETPDYKVTSSDGDIEIRQYEPVIVAEVTTEGARDEAISKGFRLLADYIFGNNTKESEIAMTAPVSQQPESERIDMTAPVSQQEAGKGTWRVTFTMPSEYTMQTLPKPNKDQVNLKKVPGKTYAVIRFSGRTTSQNIKEHEKELAAYIEQKNITPQSQPVYAFYNPPWTLPFLRRNEVMIEIEAQ